LMSLLYLSNNTKYYRAFFYRDLSKIMYFIYHFLLFVGKIDEKALNFFHIHERTVPFSKFSVKR